MLLLTVPEHAYDWQCCSDRCLILSFGLLFSSLWWGFLFFHGCWWLVVFWSDLKYPFPHCRVISQFFSGWQNHEYREILGLYEDIVFHTWVHEGFWKRGSWQNLGMRCSNQSALIWMDRSVSSCSHWHELDGQEHKKLQSELIDMHWGFVNQHLKYYPQALSVIFMLVRGDYGTAIHLAALRCFSHPLHIWLYGGPFRVYMEPFWILYLLLRNNEGEYMGSHVHWLNPSIVIRSNLLVVGVSTVSSMRFMECIVEDYPDVQMWRFWRCLVSKDMHF